MQHRADFLEVLKDTYFWYVISKRKRVRLVMSQIHAVSSMSKESRPYIDSLKRACLIKKLLTFSLCCLFYIIR